MTVFVYLNDVQKCGRTRWRWTTDDPSFYDNPSPWNLNKIPWSHPNDDAGIDITPEAGLAVLHFPATTPETGGITDRNAIHEAEEAVDTKFITQQFIFSHPMTFEGYAFDPSIQADPNEKPDMSVTF